LTKIARGCVRTLGALQTILAWTEERAPLRSTPSSTSRAKTGTSAKQFVGSVFSRSLSPLWDWHRREKPLRYNAATSRTRFYCASRRKFRFTAYQDSIALPKV